MTEEGGLNQGSDCGKGESGVDLKDKGSEICWTGVTLYREEEEERNQDIGVGENESSAW